MHFRLFPALLIALLIPACSQNNDPEHDTEHEELKVRYTVYTDNFEMFAEADPLVAGKTANILSHFTVLPDFKPLPSGKVTLKLNVNGQVIEQTAEEPVRKGIYSFNIRPEESGAGTIEFTVISGTDQYEIIVPEMTVYANDQEAEEAVEQSMVPGVNSMAFSKLRSWKIDFSTGYPRREPFGQAIKTTAMVEPAVGNEVIVTAKTGGIISFAGDIDLEGNEVSVGRSLFVIKGSGFAEDNSAVRFTEAKNNYEQAKADYERAKILAADKIVSEKQLLEAKTLYENTKSAYENMDSNTSPAGQVVASPMSGYVRQLLVENGQYVDAGQPLTVISQNRSLLLRAEVQQKYAPVLNSISSANIRTVGDEHTYTLEELNGRLVSVGKATAADNFLIPVNLWINNNGAFIPGSFVELYLKTVTDSRALTVPGTSIMEEQGNFFVYVQITPELFEKREIEIGATDGISTEVLSGLADDERIVTRGAMLIKLSQVSGALDAHSGHVH